MHYGLIIVLKCLILIANGHPSPTVDQSQTGDLNVHINLKDIRIFALLKGSTEEYVDYDYAYDYSEMTIKPQNSTTTPKPANLTGTSDESVTETTAPLAETTLATKNATDSVITEPTTAALVNFTSTNASNANTTVINAPISTEVVALVTNNSSVPKNSTECKKNFTMNKNGDCKLNMHGTSTNALLTLVKLSQKLKLRRENRRSGTGRTETAKEART